MNRFSTATRLNSTRSNQHQEIAYHEALMNILKGGNITQPPEEQIESSIIENSNYYEQQQVQSDISRSALLATESTMRSKDYTDAPGELDMLIGFFLMNSVCIVFFLMFGMCVICSCMRRKPNFMKSEKESSAGAPSKRRLLSPRSVSPKPAATAAVPPLPVTNPTFKPTFKAMITKAMKNEDFQKMAKVNNSSSTEQRRCSVTSPVFNETTHLLRRASEKPLKEETQIEMESPNNGLRCHSVTRQVQIQIEPTDIPSDKEMTPIEATPQSSNHAICPTCHPIPPEADHICDCNCENEAPHQPEADETDEEAAAGSVIRQNLLGPLSFDDLYYT